MFIFFISLALVFVFLMVCLHQHLLADQLNLYPFFLQWFFQLDLGLLIYELLNFFSAFSLSSNLFCTYSFNFSPCLLL